MKSNSALPYKHILVIRLSAMGDVAMTVPVLKSLISEYPNLRITVLSRPFFKPIFNQLPNVAFIEIDLKQTHKGFWGIFKLFNSLRNRNFDAVADLHGVLRTHLLRFLFKISGTKTSVIDKGRAEKRALTRTKNKVFKPLKTTHERYADVFREMGFSFDLQPIHSQVKTINHRKKIGVAPFAQHAAKQYPLAMMQQVVEELSKKFEVYLFGGGAKEKAVLDEWTSNSDNIKNTVGLYSFEKELKLISTLDLMISMDSGNGHLAANFGVKVLTIWGLTHPFAGFVPFGTTEKNWLMPDLDAYPNIPTSVYGNDLPKGYENATASISTEMVLKKADELLK